MGDYAQRKGEPPEEQLLPDELLAAAPPLEVMAILESCLLVWVLPQCGQAGFCEASLIRTIFSNNVPHWLQAYSYRGIFNLR